MARMRDLDGVRGVAVSLVMLHHWTTTGFSMGLGNIGVQLFFVLSGFLITGILLDMRVSLEEGTASLGKVLVSFWQSRIARIFPVVIVTLLAVYLAGDRFEKREDMGWHFAFASNFLFFRRGEFASGLAHFWTLAVEQQFYLVWPFAILLIPRRGLELAILALIALAPVTRFFLYSAGFDDFAQFNVLPISNFDSLGLGALAATWTRLPAERARTRWRALAILGIASAFAVAANRWLGPLPANIEQTLYAITFAWLISAGREDSPGALRRFLESRPLVGLGVISYGIYAYHAFAPRLVGAALRAIDAPPILQAGVPLFLLSLAATLAVACVSWFLMERPINNARRRWQRRGVPRVVRAPPSPELKRAL